MNPSHLHLLLNHLPTVGFGVGLCLYLVALWGKDASIRKASLVVLFLVAVMAIPTYISGNMAERALCPEKICPDEVSVHAIREHEDLAFLAFCLMEVTGFFAFLALWQLRWKPQPAAWNFAVILLCSLGTFGLMAVAASEGGEIRHPEIREGSDAAEPAAAITDTAQATEKGIARSIGAAVAGTTGISWLWPACETIHFIGLCLLFSVVLVVDLRILGVAKALSFSAVYQLLPLGIIGFGLNLVTGMLFFLASPDQYTTNVEFHRKIILIVIAGVNVLYFMLFDEAWLLGPGDVAPLRAKFAAVMAIGLWIGILYYGHMLPFLGNSF